MSVVVTLVWSHLVSLVAYKIVDALVGPHVKADKEREGLDRTAHGKTPCHL